MRVEQSIYQKVALPKLVEINVGKTPARKDQDNFGGGYPWISISDMNNSRYLTTTKETLSKKGLISSNIKPVAPNTLLFSFKLSIGKVAITSSEMYTNEAIAAFPIKDTSKLDLNYFFYVMSSFNFADAGVRAVMGKTLNKAKLQQIKIPLPPLPIQKKIAAILDAADELRQKTKALIEKYDQLIQSLFLEMFGDPVRNEKGWARIPISKACTRIYGGGTPSKSKPEFYTGDIPWVTPKDMKTQLITDSVDHITNIAIEHSSTRLIPKRSVLMVIRSGILKKKLPVAINSVAVAINQDMKAFLPDKKLTNSEYMHNYFLAVSKYLLGKVRAVTADNIEFKLIQELPYSIPPLHLQFEFAERSKEILKQKQYAVLSFKKSESLFQSLLQKAFKGELIN